MVEAYVLLTTATGATPGLVPELEALDTVTAVSPITGEYDVLVDVETSSLPALKTTLMDRIRPLSGVEAVQTQIALQ